MTFYEIFDFFATAKLPVFLQYIYKTSVQFILLDTCHLARHAMPKDKRLNAHPCAHPHAHATTDSSKGAQALLTTLRTP